MKSKVRASVVGGAVLIAVLGLIAGGCGTSSDGAGEEGTADGSSATTEAAAADPTPPDDPCTVLPEAAAITLYNAIGATSTPEHPMPTATAENVSASHPGAVTGTDDLGTLCLYTVSPASPDQPFDLYEVWAMVGSLSESTPPPGEEPCYFPYPSATEPVAVDGLGDEALVTHEIGVLCAGDVKALVGAGSGSVQLPGDSAAVEAALREVASNLGL
ncbi:MAG TPA: hypothetical protein VIY72_08040 [Acidimicrobiales bacterium]